MAAKRSTSGREGSAARKPKQKAGSDTGLTGSGAVEKIQELIDVMIRSGAVEVELQDEGQKIRVRLKEDHGPGTPADSPQPAQPPAPQPSPTQSSPSQGEHGDLAEGQELFKSPMVGTFYLSPSPDAEAFIQAGDVVDADTTLCIIEAMKVMNEIKAERELQIIDILAQNGEPVEFGQPLFLVAV